MALNFLSCNQSPSEKESTLKKNNLGSKHFLVEQTFFSERDKTQQTELSTLKVYPFPSKYPNIYGEPR